MITLGFHPVKTSACVANLRNGTQDASRCGFFEGDLLTEWAGLQGRATETEKAVPVVAVVIWGIGRLWTLNPPSATNPAVTLVIASSPGGQCSPIPFD